MNCKDIAGLGSLYLSGELDGQRGFEFREHLQACSACGAELERQRRLDASLREHVLSEEIDSTVVDQRIRQQLAAGRSIFFSGRRLAVAAGILVAVVGATLGYRAAFAPAPPRLCADAAQDHRSEVLEHQHRRWLSDPKAIAELAQRSGLSGLVVTALAPPGYRLEQGKLCRLDGRLFLHLVFARGSSEFSTYLRPLDGKLSSFAANQANGEKAVGETETAHQHVAYFQTQRVTAMFVSDQPAEAVRSIARYAAQVL